MSHGGSKILLTICVCVLFVVDLGRDDDSEASDEVKLVVAGDVSIDSSSVPWKTHPFFDPRPISFTHIGRQAAPPSSRKSNPTGASRYVRSLYLSSCLHHSPTNSLTKGNTHTPTHTHTTHTHAPHTHTELLQRHAAPRPPQRRHLPLPDHPCCLAIPDVSRHQLGNRRT